jgi:hypothetical protein
VETFVETRLADPLCQRRFPGAPVTALCRQNALDVPTPDF